MFKFHNILSNQLIIWFLVSFFSPITANADIHLIYKNQINPNQKLDIYLKKGLFKINNEDNIIKIVDNDKKSLILYKSGDNKYLQLKINVQSKSEKIPLESAIGKKKKLFNPKLAILKGEEVIGGVKAMLMRYSSDIDKPVKIYCARGFLSDLIDSMKESIGYISRKGNELIKEPSYYYALSEGFLPLHIKSDEYEWKAEIVENLEIDNNAFMVTKEMTLWKTKDYFKDVVDTISDELD